MEKKKKKKKAEKETTRKKAQVGKRQKVQTVKEISNKISKSFG